MGASGIVLRCISLTSRICAVRANRARNGQVVLNESPSYAAGVMPARPPALCSVHSGRADCSVRIVSPAVDIPVGIEGTGVILTGGYVSKGGIGVQVLIR